MLKLRFKNNKNSGVWLVEPKVTIGSSTANHFTISGDSEIVESHAEIIVEHENLTLLNLAEGNKLQLNGADIKEPTKLKVGDELILGATVLEIIDPKTEMGASKKSPANTNKSTGWSLKAKTAALSNRTFPLKAETVVGRSNDCDITLGAAHLSRRHAKLVIKDDGLHVTDLNSSNGTYVNGRKINEAWVKHGDEIRFDTLSFTVLGHSEDLDKTSVRPNMADTHKGRPAATKSSAKAKAKTVVVESTMAAPADDYPRSLRAAETGSGMIIWVVAGLAAVAIGVAVLGIQQGWFGG